MIHIYCDSVGERLVDGPNEKRVSGPYMVAYYLFQALKQYAQFEYHFHTNEKSRLIDPRISLFEKFVPGMPAHIMGNAQRVLAAQENHSTFPALILGPNVLFNLADGDLENSPTENNRSIIQRETKIAEGPFNLLLFPGFWHGAPETLNRRLRARPVTAFPCGIETPDLALVRREPTIDFLILSKAPYSETTTYTHAKLLADQLIEKLSPQHSITRIESFERTDLPIIVSDHRVVIYTSPWETQGLARLEASALRPVVARNTLPYQAPNLSLLMAEYNADSFFTVAVKALADWRQLADLSSTYVTTQFSLRTMYENYLTILMSSGVKI